MQTLAHCGIIGRMNNEHAATGVSPHGGARMSRRGFLSSAAAAVAVQALHGCASRRGFAANSRVRLACIGAGAQAWYDIREFMKCGDICEIVALCDTEIGAEPTVPALRAFPSVPRFTDFRAMFDAMADSIDAVLVATPDHSHFPAAMHAMRLGKAVYVEKPLAHTFEECRLLAEAARRYGVVTQMGNQGHSSGKYHQFKEYVGNGTVKDVRRAVVHMNMSRRWHKWGGKVDGLPPAGRVPAGMDWNAWLAGARERGYSDEYMRGEWRCWYDFGCGCLGDWGAHLMDCMHEFLLKCDLPSRVEVLHTAGWNRFVYPCASTLAFTFPANALHGDFRLEWYDGADNLPELPRGFVYATPDGIPQNSANDDSSRPKLFPGKEMYCGDGTVWQSLSHRHLLHLCGDYDAKLPEFPPETETHYRNFLLAVRGEQRARSPFEVAAPLSQVFALGCIAQRLDRGFTFDAAAGAVPGDAEADFLLKGPPPRAGWEVYYRV